MIAHYKADAEIEALFLIGSVATNTARPNSDIDAVAVVSQENYEHRVKTGQTLELHFDKCTYEGGYFDIHYTCREEMEKLAANGSEPMRNMFSCAQTLFCNVPDLPEIAARIPIFPKSEAAAKQLRFYCTFKMYHRYFWMSCKPEGFMRFHVADGMIFNLYRLILLENELLFPSLRKLEETVTSAKHKPAGIVELCHQFMKTLADEDCRALVESYEAWTSYNYPKEHSIIMNNYSDSWELQ